MVDVPGLVTPPSAARGIGPPYALRSPVAAIPELTQVSTFNFSAVAWSCVSAATFTLCDESTIDVSAGDTHDCFFNIQINSNYIDTNFYTSYPEAVIFENSRSGVQLGWGGCPLVPEFGSTPYYNGDTPRRAWGVRWDSGTGKWTYLDRYPPTADLTGAWLLLGDIPTRPIDWFAGDDGIIYAPDES